MSQGACAFRAKRRGTSPRPTGTYDPFYTPAVRPRRGGGRAPALRERTIRFTHQPSVHAAAGDKPPPYGNVRSVLHASRPPTPRRGTSPRPTGTYDPFYIPAVRPRRRRGTSP